MAPPSAALVLVGAIVTLGVMGLALSLSVMLTVTGAIATGRYSAALPAAMLCSIVPVCSPSTKLSSVAFTVTVCGRFQLAEVKVNVEIESI